MKKQSAKNYKIKNWVSHNLLKLEYGGFYPAKSDINCQLADYCGWAVFIKWERDEKRPYEAIKDKLKSEFDFFERGEITYYDYNIKIKLTACCHSE